MIFIYSVYSACLPLFTSLFVMSAVIIIASIISYENEKQQNINISKLVDYHWKKYYKNQRKRLSYNKMQQYCEKNIN
jgi:hypothetical protein